MTLLGRILIQSTNQSLKSFVLFSVTPKMYWMRQLRWNFWKGSSSIYTWYKLHCVFYSILSLHFLLMIHLISLNLVMKEFLRRKSIFDVSFYLGKNSTNYKGWPDHMISWSILQNRKMWTANKRISCPIDYSRKENNIPIYKTNRKKHLDKEGSQ